MLKGKINVAATKTTTPKQPVLSEKAREKKTGTPCGCPGGSPKWLRRIFRESGKRREIVFDRGVYVDKNTFQAASVEFVRSRRTNYARSRLQKLAEKPKGLFRQFKAGTPCGCPGGRLFMESEKRTGDPFVQEHGQSGDYGALQQVQGSYAEHDEGGDIGHAAPDLTAHGDDAFQGQTVELGEFGQQINGVEGAAEDGHGQCAQHKSDDGGMLALMHMVPDSGGKHKGAAYHEIGKITHEGGGGALDHQLQQDLDAFACHGSRGTQVKTAQQHGQFGEVQLVEAGCQEQQGEIQHMQHSRDGGADADDADF